jgi:acetylornithine deacetylase/succinyl-diaminopimelate desuccinylase-like protein
MRIVRGPGRTLLGVVTVLVEELGVVVLGVVVLGVVVPGVVVPGVVLPGVVLPGGSDSGVASVGPVAAGSGAVVAVTGSRSASGTSATAEAPTEQAVRPIARSAANPRTRPASQVEPDALRARARRRTVRTMSLPPSAAKHVDARWDEIVPVLHEYIAIPNVSESFDPQWREHGHMAEAVELIRRWCETRSIPGLTVEVHELPGRSPIILAEVPATGGASDDTVLLYGHLDKQPEMEGWRDGLGPWTPVLDGDRLYGRGGADDGYAAFASLTAIEAVHAAAGDHARLIVLIEASEESGSPDLPAYVEAFADRIGSPSLVICLDSGCIDYERMWVTTSLRGMATATLRVDIVDEGLHSGDVSGMVPSTFRIARTLLSRIEDESTGAIRLGSVEVEIPADRLEQAVRTAEEIGRIADHYPFVAGAGPTTDDPAEQLLSRTWRAALSVVGADGLPPTGRAGNVLRPSTSLKLSLRVPPTADAAAAAAEMARVLATDPPYGARVTVSAVESGPGWNAPALAPWLEKALDEASTRAFGRPARLFGEGGSIPFMGMLGERFPDAQFVITGVLGPDANAHGPNEYLHVPTARRLTMAVADLLAAHAHRSDT